MGAGGVPKKAIMVVHGRYGDLPTKGAKPNSRYDLYVNGEKVQSRWFDNNGNAIRNRDYKHQDAHKNHQFPHDHDWDWNRKPPRNKNWIKADYNNFK